MTKNTSISLGSHFDDFIQGRISAGRYKNASKVVRAGLLLLEEEESRMDYRTDSACGRRLLNSKSMIEL